MHVLYLNLTFTPQHRVLLVVYLCPVRVLSVKRAPRLLGLRHGQLRLRPAGGECTENRVNVLSSNGAL